MADIPEPELSRPLHVEKIGAGGIEETIVAKPAERESLAARFGLLDLSKLEAKLDIRRTRGDVLVAIKGSLRAELVQQCVVTLERLPAKLEEKIEILFAEPEMIDPGANPSHAEAGEEEIEPIEGGVIDLGELVAQYLGAALDPYPRKPGAAFGEAEFGKAETQQNPFAKLVVLPKKPIK